MRFQQRGKNSFALRSLIFFLVLTGIYFFPLVLKLTTHIYGYPGDSFEDLWGLWAFKSAPQLLASLPDLGAFQFISVWFPRILTLLTSEVVAYNFYFLLSFILAGWFGSLLVKKITGDTPSALLCGFFYAFSLYHFWQGMIHQVLAQIQWLPLFVWSLLNLEESLRGGKNLLKNSMVMALVFSITFLTTFYYGYFSLLIMAGFFLFQLGYSWRKREAYFWRRRLLSLVYFSLGVFCLTLVSTLPLLRYTFGLDTSSSVAVNYQKTFARIDNGFALSLAARPWDYFLPSIYHPLFGGWVKRFYDSIPNWGLNYAVVLSAYLPERVIYLGLTVCFLAFGGWWWGRREEKYRKLVWLFGFLAVYFAVFSAPAYITHGSLKIYFPSFYLRHLFPMFRSYVRMGLLVQLCLIILAGIGLARIFERWRGRGGLVVRAIWVVIFALSVFENLTFSPFPLADVTTVPAVYQWLRSQPSEVLVAEYPLDQDLGGGCPEWLKPKIRKGYPKTYSYIFQRLHHHQFLVVETLPTEEQKLLADLSQVTAVSLLKRLGVSYVLSHRQDYFSAENPFDACQKRRVTGEDFKVVPGLVLEKEFPDALVYKVI